MVKFTTEKQETIVIQLNYAVSKPVRLGRTIDIIYNPANPRQVEANSLFQLVILPWLFTIMGLAGIVMASLEMLDMTHVVMTEWESD